jgi:PIN domain nuclease of toxin-antitoxin system
MTCLLDTHFLIWVLAKARRLKQFPWLADYSPWGVSPISLLEIQILSETGRIKLTGDFAASVMADSRFILDEAPSVTLVQKAMDLAWTRDPFDRLIVAHSLVRRLPLCSVDSNIIANHRLILRDLRI